MAGDNPLQPFDGVYAVDSSHLEVSGGLGDTCRKPLQEPLCSSSKGFGGGGGDTELSWATIVLYLHLISPNRPVPPPPAAAAVVRINILAWREAQKEARGAAYLPLGLGAERPEPGAALRALRGVQPCAPLSGLGQALVCPPGLAARTTAALLPGSQLLLSPHKPAPVWLPPGFPWVSVLVPICILVHISQSQLLIAVLVPLCSHLFS